MLTKPLFNNSCIAVPKVCDPCHLKQNKKMFARLAVLPRMHVRRAWVLRPQRADICLSIESPTKHSLRHRPRTLVLGSWGNTMRGAVRNKGRWKRRRRPTQYPSTYHGVLALAVGVVLQLLALRHLAQRLGEGGVGVRARVAAAEQRHGLQGWFSGMRISGAPFLLPRRTGCSLKVL